MTTTVSACTECSVVNELDEMHIVTSASNCAGGYVLADHILCEACYDRMMGYIPGLHPDRDSTAEVQAVHRGDPGPE